MSYLRAKSISIKKTRHFLLRNFCLLYYTQEFDVTTSYYPISALFSAICQVVVYGMLKTKQNFKLLALKVVAVAYERWSLTRGSKCSDLTRKHLVFGKLFAEEKLSLTRGGRSRRFDCMSQGEETRWNSDSTPKEAGILVLVC